ncbi:MAG: cyclic nucleotide-binding domain-containing protein, partial [Vicinamibacteraceae bacterium]
MSNAWTLSLAYGIAALAALEVLYLLLRRILPGFHLRLVYHLWVLSLAAVIALSVAGVDRDALGWKLAASAAAMLSPWVLFALFNAAVLKRPWRPETPFLPKLARDVLTMGVVIAGGLAAVNIIFGMDLQAVLVSSTVLSAVAGLALQDVLKNIFAGVALDLEKPFALGDWLILDGQTPVQVMDMSWRTTRLRTREGLEIHEPNAQMSSARLLNYGAGRWPVAQTFRLGLPYDAAPADVKQALKVAAHSVPGTAEHPPVVVFLESFGDHAITYYMRVWTRNVADIPEFRDAVQSRLWYELKRRGLSIPFPVRTVHLHSAETMAMDERRGEHERALTRFAELELLRGLDPKIVRTLAEGATRRQYDNGEILVREGEAGESLLVIDEGAAVVTKASNGRDGLQVEVGRLGDGDFFGEGSLLTGAPRGATVRADGGCIVLEIAKPQLARILSADPSVAGALSHALAMRQSATTASLASHDERLRSAVPAPSEA